MEDRRPDYICNCCDRRPHDKVTFSQVRFAVNPKKYTDFYQNDSICSFCINLISEVFGYDFSEINEDLLDNYAFFKNNEFFKLDNEKQNENDLIFILGITATMTEDYHILIVQEEHRKAVENTVNGLKKYSTNPINSFKDLLR